MTSPYAQDIARALFEELEAARKEQDDARFLRIARVIIELVGKTSS